MADESKSISDQVLDRITNSSLDLSSLLPAFDAPAITGDLGSSDGQPEANDTSFDDAISSLMASVEKVVSVSSSTLNTSAASYPTLNTNAPESPLPLAQESFGESLAPIPLATDYSPAPYDVQPDDVPDAKEGSLSDAISIALKPVIDLLGRINQGLGKAPGKSDSENVPYAELVKKPKEKEPEKQGSSFSALAGFGDVFSQLGSKVTGLFSELQSNISKIVGFAHQAASFVSAFNPALVERMNFAFRDMTATIGVALTPIVEGATRISRMVGSVLLPVMQQLQPVIARLTSAFLQLLQNNTPAFARLSQFLVDAADKLANMAISLTPLITGLQSVSRFFMQINMGMMQGLLSGLKLLELPLKGLGNLIESLTPVFDALTANLSGVMAVMETGFNRFAAGIGKFIGVFDASNLRTAFESLARSALLAGMHLSKMLGFGSEYLDGVRKALSPAKTQDNTGLAAIQSTSFSSITDVGRNVSLAMAKASGSDPGLSDRQKDEAWQKDLLMQMKAINEGDSLAKKISDDIRNWLREEIREAVGKVIDSLKPELPLVGQGLESSSAARAARVAFPILSVLNR